jgi:hypothetical protein
MIVARGNPDAEHARAFVETVADPEGLFAPRPVKPAVNATTIKFNGIKQRVFLDGHGRVIGHGDHAERPSPRGTFAGDFLDAKRAAVMPPEEPEAP